MVELFVLKCCARLGLNSGIGKQLEALQRFVKDNDLPLGIVVNNSTEVWMLADRIV